MSDASPDGGAALATDSKPSGARFWALALGSVGVVFGDIGTSPLYAFKESIHHINVRNHEAAGIKVTP
jgi:KUP system potassium uptake protein